MKPIKEHTIGEDHSYQILWSELNWMLLKDKHNISINPKYADDIGFLRSDESKIRQIERLVATMLKGKNQLINTDKTEKIVISRESDNSW